MGWPKNGLNWLRARVRAWLALIPWPGPMLAYEIACWSTLIPVFALLEISVLPCNAKWTFRNMDVSSGPTLLMFSMILLLANFAWITDLAMLAGTRKPGFHPLCAFSVALAVLTLIVMGLHLLGNDDLRVDPQPVIFFFFVLVVFVSYALFNRPHRSRGESVRHGETVGSNGS